MEQATLPSGTQTIDLSAARFWEGVAEERLIIQACADCGMKRYPPKPHCPECWSEDFSEADAAGTGSVYTFIVYERAFVPALTDHVPYVAALIELDEGPKIWTNIIDVADEDEISIGARVVFHFERDGDATVPRCRLA